MSPWRLDPAEVESGVSDPRPGGAGRRRVWLRHRPTGEEVAADLPGAPVRPPVLEVELRKSLFAELEMKVARRLGRPVSPTSGGRESDGEDEAP